MEDAIRRHATTTQSPAAALQAAARSLLVEARTGPASRDTALTLLTADALITYACEAAAEDAT